MTHGRDEIFTCIPESLQSNVASVSRSLIASKTFFKVVALINLASNMVYFVIK